MSTSDLLRMLCEERTRELALVRRTRDMLWSVLENDVNGMIRDDCRDEYEALVVAGRRPERFRPFPFFVSMAIIAFIIVTAWTAGRFSASL